MTAYTGGNTVNDPRVADLVAGSSAHVGVSAVTFSFPCRGITITVYAGKPFHAESGLQAFIGSLAPQFSGAITWSS